MTIKAMSYESLMTAYQEQTRQLRGVGRSTDGN